MIEGTISLFAAVPAALIHPLDFFVASSRSLVLLRSRNWYKRVNLLSTILSMNQLLHIDMIREKQSKQLPTYSIYFAATQFHFNTGQARIISRICLPEVVAPGRWEVVGGKLGAVPC